MDVWKFPPVFYGTSPLWSCYPKSAHKCQNSGDQLTDIAGSRRYYMLDIRGVYKRQINAVYKQCYTIVYKH